MRLLVIITVLINFLYAAAFRLSHKETSLFNQWFGPDIAAWIGIFFLFFPILIACVAVWRWKALED